MKKIIFIDRDGTLISEPADTKQVNSISEINFLPNVILSLKELQNKGYRLVLVSNQDGLGTVANPRENYDDINKFVQKVLASEQIYLDEIFTCPHMPEDNCNCRKPNTGLVDKYFRENQIDVENSYMVGDRQSDLEFATNLRIKGIIISKDNTWQNISNKILKSPRKTYINRKSAETDISLELNIDGTGEYEISTGLNFFDHMLEQLSRHSNFDLKIKCVGDLAVDEHHTIEDVGIVLGEALRKTLGDKIGIERYDWERILVMDESVTELALDISGRAYLVFKAEFKREYVGDFPTEMLEHFLESFCKSAGLNLYIKISGKNAHHKIESCFKALAKCLKNAVEITSSKLPTTKKIL